MLNNFVLVGRLMEEIEDSNIKVSVSRLYKNEDGNYENDIIEVFITDNILGNMKEYCTKGSLLGIKGRIESKEDKMILVADKITFLQSSN